MRFLRAVATAALVLGSHTIAQAQTCAGAATFSSGPVRLGAGLATSDNVKSYGLDLAAGAPVGPFASATVSRAEYDGIEGAGTVLGVTGGYAIDVNATKTIQFCPHASFGYQTGPDIDLGFTTVSTSAHAFGFGGSIGGIVPASPNFDFVPFAAASYVISRASASDGASSESQSEDYTEIEIGAGFVINKVITLQPAVSFPVGIDGAKATFRLAFAFNFGSSPTRR